MWGLPAVTRAVPAYLRRVARAARGAARAGTPAPAGGTFIELVSGLPPDLLRHALTHSSWVGRRIGSYERLEFLGDSVLGLAIAGALFDRFPDREEGGLARLKAFVVSRASCVQVAEQVGLASVVLEHAPASERRRREVVRSPSLLGDVLEALVGALYLHYGFERVRPAVTALFEEQIRYAATAHVDHKTALQEVLAPRGQQPLYQLVEESGPAHARSFTSEVVVDGAVRGRGVGKTIKMSEQAAAREALSALAGGVHRAGASEGPIAGGEIPRGGSEEAGDGGGDERRD